MKRFASFLLVLTLLFCSTTVVYADFVYYPTDLSEDPYAPAPLSFDSPAVTSYKYFVDQENRPDLYAIGTSFWGLTGTNTWEHSQHDGVDYITWATYRVNYQVYVNDDRSSDTPFCMTSIRLRLKAPMSGTEVRVSGFSDNVNLAIQGLTDSNSTLIIDAHLRDTLVIPADSGARVSFYIDFNVMFDPSKPSSELAYLTENNSPILPMMDGTGFQPRIYSYLPSGTVGGASASGQQQIDQSINAGIAQDQQQYQDTQNQFQQATNSGQAELTDQFDTVAGDLHSYEEQIFQDIDDYKVQLNFSLDTWSEVQDGLGYVRRIFMIIWDNSPTQIVTLSLMLGLAMYLLGRGAVFERAARRSRRGGEE